MFRVEVIFINAHPSSPWAQVGTLCRSYHTASELFEAFVKNTHAKGIRILDIARDPILQDQVIISVER